MKFLPLFTWLCLWTQLGNALSVDCSANNACEGQLITIPSDSVFDVNCQGYRSCFGAKFVVEHSSSMISNFECNRNTEACKNMTVVVFDSDLKRDGSVLSCRGPAENVDSCDNVNLTLVRSSMMVSCETGTCDALRVTLYDSELNVGSASTQMWAQLFGANALNCNNYRSCYGSHVVVASGSTLLANINCEGDSENCRGMELEVYDSDLAASGFILDCFNKNGVDACDDMKITLVRSSLKIKCSDDNCDGITVNLYDSEFVIRIGSDDTSFANGNLQVYLYGSSVLTDRTGLGQYIDMYYMTTAKPTSTRPLTSTKTPTTTATVSTTTTTVLPLTTTVELSTTTRLLTTTMSRMPTTTSTTLPSTSTRSLTSSKTPTTTTPLPKTTTTPLPTTTHLPTITSLITTDTEYESSATVSTLTHSSTENPTNNKRSQAPMLVILVATFSVLVAVCGALTGMWLAYSRLKTRNAPNAEPGLSEIQLPAIVVGTGVAEGGHVTNGCEDSDERGLKHALKKVDKMERDAKDVAFGQVLGDFNVGITMLEEDVVEDMDIVGETAGYQRREGETTMRTITCESLTTVWGEEGA